LSSASSPDTHTARRLLPLPREFYARDTLVVARALLGQRLVRTLDGQRCSGLISEVEAYTGPDDAASHAFRRTPRSSVMYGPPGHAYVYFIYGANFCLNAVAKSAAQAAGAVLLRAILPQEGIELMRSRRGTVPDRHLTDGPGKLCKALAIDRSLYGADLTTGGELCIEEAVAVPDAEVSQTPRVGVVGDELALTRQWRFIWRPVSGWPSA
jgi:DNA-3-methyladenine glycosylase